MLYFIQFIYGFLLFSPGPLIIILLFLAWRSRRRQKGIALALAAVSLLTYLFSTAWLGNMLVRSLESRYYPPAAVSGDVIIMLGGGATLDTPNIGGKGHLSGAAANRLLTAAQLHRKLGLPIIVSGGQVYQDCGVEADIAKAALINLGVSPANIIVENTSLNTTQNARNCAEILVRHNFTRPVLVTSAFHMERAVLQFKKAGVAVVPFPTDYMRNISGAVNMADLLPGSSWMQGLAMKEYLGIAAAKWY